MPDSRKPEALTLSDFMARYADPSIIKSGFYPAFPARDYGIEIKPMSPAEMAMFAIRNKRDEWRERLALWIAPWLESDD